MRLAVTSLFTLLALTLALLPPARALTADWQTFEPDGGGFTVEMPGKPSLKSEDRNGHKTDTALVAIDKAAAGANLVFMVKYQARSGAPGPDAAALLQSVVKAMSSGNKLISDDEDEIEGFPARAFVMQDSEDTIRSGSCSPTAISSRRCFWVRRTARSASAFWSRFRSRSEAADPTSPRCAGRGRAKRG